MPGDFSKTPRLERAFRSLGLLLSPPLFPTLLGEFGKGGGVCGNGQLWAPAVPCLERLGHPPKQTDSGVVGLSELRGIDF